MHSSAASSSSSCAVHTGKNERERERKKRAMPRSDKNSSKEEEKGIASQLGVVCPRRVLVHTHKYKKVVWSYSRRRRREEKRRKEAAHLSSKGLYSIT